MRIIDNTTKEDLTEVTLAQIIFEEQKSKGQRNVPIQTLKDMGGKIFKIVFEGWDLAASGADYVTPMASASSKATKKDPLLPGNASGTTNWRGGLTWVGERGPELINLPRGSQVFSNQRSMAMAGAGGGTVNNYYTTTVQATVDNTIDIQELAYRVAAIIQRKAGRG